MSLNFRIHSLSGCRVRAALNEMRLSGAGSANVYTAPTLKTLHLREVSLKTRAVNPSLVKKVLVSVYPVFCVPCRPCILKTIKTSIV